MLNVILFNDIRITVLIQSQHAYNILDLNL